MKIEKVIIENYRRLDGRIDLDVNGRHVWVTADNGMGKTSLLDAIFKTLTKKLPKKLAGDQPTNLVNTNAQSAFAEIHLKDDAGVSYTVHSQFDKKDGNKLTVTASNVKGALKAGRTVLDEIIGVVDLDLDSLFMMQPKDQLEFIKSITGIDFEEIDSQIKLAQENARYKEKRAKELDTLCQNTTYDYSLVSEEELSVQASYENLEKALAFNTKHLGIISEIAAMRTRIENLDDEVSALMNRLDEIANEKRSVISRINKGCEWLEKPNNAPKDVESLREAFSNQEARNIEIRKAKAGAARNVEMHEADKQAREAKEELAALNAKKRQMIEESNIPVKGMTFNEDGLFLGELPFNKSTINTATLQMAALQLQLPLMKKAKFLRFVADRLSNKTMDMILAWGDANGLQFFIEQVDHEGGDLKVEFVEPATQAVEA